MGICDGRVVVITGAGRGIGREHALEFASQGAKLVINDLGAEVDGSGSSDGPAGQVVDEVRAMGGEAVANGDDVSDYEGAGRLIQTAIDTFGTIDVLVNNAGTSTARPLDELTDEDWRLQWELNVLGPMRLMRAAAPTMAERGWGRIVNVCSSSGKRPGQRNVAYSVAKAGQLSLSRAFADAYAKRGVLVNAITPGPVTTELWTDPGGLADQVAAARGTTREEVLESTAAGVPLGRFGSPQEIANVIAFLCSDAVSNVAGAAWSVDGGLVAVII